MATSHRQKRPFQPSNQTRLDSFFSRDNTTATPRRPMPATSPMSPALSPDVESSLLNVGMRVRKSVPEGYKTHKTLGTCGYPFPSSDSLGQTSSAPVRSTVNPCQTRELMPFCGLHKTGGWAAQGIPLSGPVDMRRGTKLEDDDMPGLSMSQNTISSTQDSFISLPPEAQFVAGSKKRAYEDEQEDDMDGFFDEMDADADNRAALLRPIARMKGSQQSLGNGEQVRISGDADDFGEATFLMPLDRRTGEES